MNGLVASVHDAMHRRLGRVGQVVVAGGSVRDVLMGRNPKDIDVFVLVGAPIEAVITTTAEALSDLDAIETPEWHKSEPFLQATVRYNGAMVQVMLSPYATVDALLDSFDWNVSMFAYDGQTVTQRTEVEDIAEGKPLVLHRVTFPLSTLRRGFRFSERFLMVMQPADIKRLCWLNLEPARKATDATPAV